jgi:hypothetical protein
MNYIQLSALFLRLGRPWQRLLQVSIVLLGVFLLFGAARTPSVWGQVWLTLVVGGYVAVYLRDDGVLRGNGVAPTTLEHPFYDTRYAFNPTALAATLVCKVCAFVAYCVWCDSEAAPLPYLSVLVFVEHLVDILVVEALRLVHVVRSEHVPFLNALWAPLRTERAPADALSLLACGSTRFFTIAAETTREPLTTVGEDEDDVMV